MAIEISDKLGKPLASVDPTAVTKPLAAVAEGPGFLLVSGASPGLRAQIEAGS